MCRILSHSLGQTLLNMLKLADRRRFSSVRTKPTDKTCSRFIKVLPVAHRVDTPWRILQLQRYNCFHAQGFGSIDFPGLKEEKISILPTQFAS